MHLTSLQPKSFNIVGMVSFGRRVCSCLTLEIRKKKHKDKRVYARMNKLIRRLSLFLEQQYLTLIDWVQVLGYLHLRRSVRYQDRKFNLFYLKSLFYMWRELEFTKDRWGTMNKGLLMNRVKIDWKLYSCSRKAGQRQKETKRF